jgi:hypothetical protein
MAGSGQRWIHRPATSGLPCWTPPTSPDALPWAWASEFESEDIKPHVAAKGSSPLRPDELLTHLVDRSPHHLVPRCIEVLARLPRPRAAKVQK